MSKTMPMSAPELPPYEPLHPEMQQQTFQPMLQTQQVQQMPAPPPVSVIMNPGQQMMQMAVGPKAQMMTCPNCRNMIKTTTKTEAVTKTHLVALLLCCCLCWPCVCLPYCMNSCQNVNHYCPNCDTFLGTYQH